ncbi:alpha-N-methyltransferase NTM1 [Thamnocephalis sphaerospora]|uniref:Alpha N-terminal protein methyltransferase 1 n=1 Tax=Thamnocephalis sphaerospora TaxID=78915 RepID=A0A4P9XQU7_9FUNG|nr:alpha-N-methyltransferase NTM1 [Thamnocephalis sphaerospora]|eukprot:RKP07881.1 alpha-N-methyltransferase NTM1 [Thamnocephalis sphaerospora]
MASDQSAAFTPTTTWYADARTYWENVTPTVDGMLGGYGQLTNVDARDSIRFLDEFVNGKMGARGRVLAAPRIGKGRACDCGAGIGRVSKHTLLQLFDQVDLVECTEKFLTQARTEVLRDEVAADRVGRFICTGLEQFEPEAGRYNLIWCQWVLGHLTDDDLVAFLQRCAKSLPPGGIIGIKENCAVSEYAVDTTDSSVTRSDAVFRSLFARAGLTVLKVAVQSSFPNELFTVRMYALALDEA